MHIREPQIEKNASQRAVAAH
jgi:hypothetical protein